MDALKAYLEDQARLIHPQVWTLAKEIGENPELGYNERFAVDRMSVFLSEHGFEVKHGIAGIETAFIARYQGNNPGPKIAFLAEYDALPEVGHGCGHNLIGAASAGAAAVLSKSIELPGEVYVIGTPAEETSGAKVTLVEAGIFNDLDAAMMFHPGSSNVAVISSLALDAIEFTFKGRAAHAAAASFYGINALDALIEFFTKVNELKKKLSPLERINGIIVEGGVAPNIIPERATARFYIRARKRKELNYLRDKVTKIAKAVASKFSAQVSWENFEFSYDEMETNRALADVFSKNLQSLGVTHIAPPQTAMGSVDMGNVSRIVPSIHPYLMLGNGSEIPHTREYTQSVLSKDGEDNLKLAVLALAFTGWDVLTTPKLLAKIKQEFNNSRS